MLSPRAFLRASRLASPVVRRRVPTATAPFSSARCLRAESETPDIEDPDMNGGYLNPPAIKRQFRDPYGDWWDKTERRNFGEPVHEDNDIMGIFSLEEYTHMTPARGFVLWGFFISVVLGLSYTVKQMYPDRPSAPKEYEGGLETELGGPGALRAKMAGDEL